MKRIFVLILVFIVSIYTITVADDIRFRDIPWGCNVESLENALAFNDAMVMSNTETYVVYSECFRFSKLQRTSEAYRGRKLQSKEQIGFFTNAFCYNDLKVGGYEVSTIHAYSVYGIENGVISKEKKDASFYAAEYEFDVRDKVAAYDDLKAKLTSIYGECEEVVNDNKLISLTSGVTNSNRVEMRTAIWELEGNVQISLTLEANDGDEDDINSALLYNSLLLAYVNTSYDSQISEVDSAMQALLDKEEKDNAAADFSGL